MIKKCYFTSTTIRVTFAFKFKEKRSSILPEDRKDDEQTFSIYIWTALFIFDSA